LVHDRYIVLSWRLDEFAESVMLQQAARSGVRLARCSGIFLPLLAVLLTVDVALVALHLGHFWYEWYGTGVRSEQFRLDVEGGYAEWWEGAKGLLCVLLLAAAWSHSRVHALAALAVVFGIGTLDNLLGLHERAGAHLSVLLAPTAAIFPRAPAAFGEVAYLLAEALVIVVVLFLGFRRTLPALRPAPLAMVALIILLGGFGIGVDILTTALIGGHPIASRAVLMLEESGELMVLSVATAYAAALHWQARGQRPRSVAAPDGMPLPVAASRGPEAFAMASDPGRRVAGRRASG
jgi:hypothetical protein